MKLRIPSTAIFVTFLVQFGLAQSASELGLRLKGTSSSSSAKCENLDKGEECVKYRMIFENTGSEPVIIFNPTLSFGTGIKSIHTYTLLKNNSDEMELAQSDVKRSEEADAVFRSLFPLLEDKTPPENLTVTLGKGEEFAFEEMFVAQKYQGVVFDSREQWLSANLPYYHTCTYGKKFFCYPSRAYVRLVYQFLAPASNENLNLLDALSIRWRKVGRLPRDQSGDYTIISESIKRY